MGPGRGAVGLDILGLARRQTDMSIVTAIGMKVPAGCGTKRPAIALKIFLHSSGAPSVMLERLLPLRGPERPRPFALITLEPVCHPEQRAEDDGRIVACQVHDTSLDDEAA